MVTLHPLLAVSLSAYDGYAAPQALDSLARLGVRQVECDALGDEGSQASGLQAARIRRLSQSLRAAGLSSPSVRCALDLAGPEALTHLRQAIDFAAALGAHRLVLPAVPERHRRRACRHLVAVAAQVEAAGLVLLLTPTVEQGVLALPHATDTVAQADLPWLGLSFDTAQAVQAQPGLPVPDQLDAVRPACRHLNLCDLRQREGWFPVPVGEGLSDGLRLLRRLRRQPLPVTLALPLRWHRDRAGLWRRAPYRVPLPVIEDALRRSLQAMAGHGLFHPSP